MQWVLLINTPLIADRLACSHLGQQLVDHSVMDSSAPRQRPSTPTNGIYLIKDDDVQGTGRLHLLLLHLRLRKQIPGE